jgi:hypothetical protein
MKGRRGRRTERGTTWYSLPEEGSPGRYATRQEVWVSS